MKETLCGAGLAVYLTALMGCGDQAAPAQPADGSRGSGAASGDDANGAGSAGMTSGDATTGAGGATTGAASGGGTMTSGGTGRSDGGPVGTTGGDCVDDPSTNGHDCPGRVACGAAVDECSLTAQNCCVKAYNARGVSCAEGSACDGLTSAACDGPEDCEGGQLCCISVSVGFKTDIQHRCVPDVGSCEGGGLANRILCHTEDDCAAGENCEPIGGLPFWSICK